jgi:hypothetical protein
LAAVLFSKSPIRFFGIVIEKKRLDPTVGDFLASIWSKEMAQLFNPSLT